ncbi:NADH pyrophosphatase [Pseudoalteromonas holothuriae]|uniref:NAD(+) diphosphatase n=1 Tax=Pseudoalteromonas holothuriae TaxID=2963714 RepID=A0A9W4VS34_9GAMM|nr:MULTISPECIES: NAD(+) diphosphatase [unclassified Pseudoalteromonas]CAH9051527.1 NADH pyrophosphatase [Pseudoalteromonas sp. CIP111854]CAH9057016.1 NADH pyrophosphatase [Pseudoalteromonas sp. CIP111951]
MLHYTHMHLNRASNERKDQQWITRQINTNSRWLLIDKDRNLVNSAVGELQLLSLEDMSEFDKKNAIFLGFDEHFSYFALDVSSSASTPVLLKNSELEFVDMRRIGMQLNLNMASVGVLARGLCYWHKTHRFCGRCGYINESIEAGHARRCQNEQCQHMTFPRTDPAVIMLITHIFEDGIERCLMGRQASWPEGVYSTLAGFVDPGETLEQAVIREVKEEANIDVDDVKYIASQPWPFPSSLMLGFIGRSISTEIKIDQDDLEDAQWFSREQLNTFGQWGDSASGYKLTRPDSISRHLVEYWRAQ